MRLGVRVVGVCGVLIASAAFIGSSAQAAIGLSVALKNYYAEYEIVQLCARRAQLTAEDVETATTAIAAIEKHYVSRDRGLNLASLKKKAKYERDESFKILDRSGESGVRPYCQMSLNELVRKAKEVGPAKEAE